VQEIDHAHAWCMTVEHRLDLAHVQVVGAEIGEKEDGHGSILVSISEPKSKARATAPSKKAGVTRPSLVHPRYQLYALAVFAAFFVFSGCSGSVFSAFAFLAFGAGLSAPSAAGSGRSISSTSAIVALSPRRNPALRMRR